MSNVHGQKKCKNLEKSAKQANKYKSRRFHQIRVARERHLKNALQSCGKEFVDGLRAYYQSMPYDKVGKRLGNHRGEA